jgi:hypothetical protein
MGQACEDADGNGLLDLFVRNGDLESTTLYLREAPRGGLVFDGVLSAPRTAHSDMGDEDSRRSSQLMIIRP